MESDDENPMSQMICILWSVDGFVVSGRVLRADDGEYGVEMTYGDDKWNKWNIFVVLCFYDLMD